MGNFGVLTAHFLHIFGHIFHGFHHPCVILQLLLGQCNILEAEALGDKLAFVLGPADHRLVQVQKLLPGINGLADLKFKPYKFGDFDSKFTGNSQPFSFAPASVEHEPAGR